MSIIQIIVVIGLVAFVIFGLWLLFHIKKVQDGDDKEHYKRLRKWIKDNPDRAYNFDMSDDQLAAAYAEYNQVEFIEYLRTA